MIRFPSRSSLQVPRSLRVSALALLFGALPVAAQDPDAPFLRLDQTSRFAIQSMIDSARTAGLPSGALRSLALEGIVKTRADGRRVVAAVRDQFARFRTVQTVLGNAGDEEIVAAAAVLKAGAAWQLPYVQRLELPEGAELEPDDAMLKAGAKPTQLEIFRERHGGRADLEALTVWTDLISRGVPGEDAFSAIGKLWRDGADDVTFHRLWNDVQADISQGLNPGAALQNRIREAPGRAPPKPTQPERPQENQRSR